MIPASAHDFVSVPLNEVDPDTGNYHTVVRYDNFVRNLLKADTDPMMKIHAAIGVAGEAGELLDAIKKVYIYGQALTDAHLVNIVEELGDIEFYMQAMRNLFNLDRATILNTNSLKLSKRYRDLTFTTSESEIRRDKAE
jgi:NTP pyrophosphatase (non-canonical NTP hydrolase)